MGASAYQNLGLGGALTIDALNFEVPAVDPSATMIIVMIGLNDEGAIGDGQGNPSPAYASTYSGAFPEGVNDIFARFAAIAAGLRARAPLAAIRFVVPLDAGQIPEYAYPPPVQASCAFGHGVVHSAIAATGLPAVDLEMMPDQYAAVYYVSGPLCPTASIGECAGHPSDVGAARMADWLTAALR